MLRFKPFQGPVSHTFKDPDTGFLFEAKTRPELLKHIISYRIQNRLPPLEYINFVVENYICSQPENAGKCEEREPLKRGILKSIKGGIAILTNVTYSETVPQEEAERRAEICFKCKYNMRAEKSPVTEFADQVAFHMVGDLKTKYHDQLGNCEVCTCPLRAKVFYKGTVELEPEEVVKMSEVGCWQLEINKNG